MPTFSEMRPGVLDPSRARANFVDRIEWMVVAVLLALISVISMGPAVVERQAIVEREKDRLTSVAQVVSEHLYRSLFAVDRALVNVRNDMPNWKGRQGGAESAARQLKAFADAMPLVRSMFVVAGDGQLLASGAIDQVIFSSKLNAAKTVYYDTIRRNPHRDLLYVSEPFVSATGAWVMNVARAVVTEDGRFDGLVGANLDFHEIRLMLATSRYVNDQYTAIVHGSGKQIVVEPMSHSLPGTDLFAAVPQLGTLVRSGVAEALLQDAGRGDGKADQLLAIKRVQNHELPMNSSLTVIAGRDEDAMLRDWGPMVIGRVAMLAVIWVMALLGLWWWQRARRSANAEASEKMRQIEQIFESSLSLLAILDKDWSALRLSSAWVRVLGWPMDHMVQRQFLQDLSHPSDTQVIDEVRQRLYDSLQAQNFSCRLCDVHGNYRDFTVQTVMLHGNTYLDARDVTDENRVRQDMLALNSQLLELSQVDALTGLANRRRFDEVLGLELRDTARNHEPLSLIMIDIDHFKRYNDHYGHVGGDACLQAIGEVLRGATGRPHDLVARYGGEEFAILLPNTNEAGALAVAESLRQRANDRQLTHAKSPTAPFVTLSIGVGTIVPTSRTNPSMLIGAADAALYRAKIEGRNRVCVNQTEGVESV